MAAKSITQVMYLGQIEVFLLESEPVMRYAKVQIVDSGKVIDVCLSALKERRDKVKPISLSWFGGGGIDK